MCGDNRDLDYQALITLFEHLCGLNVVLCHSQPTITQIHLFINEIWVNSLEPFPIPKLQIYFILFLKFFANFFMPI